ncbi:MAG TPA: polysaccharide deacetylase family protein [Vitreimonas sp.]|nr:polysaccharide deacetylase family protein [Vitreimonas sp.]
MKLPFRKIILGLVMSGITLMLILVGIYYLSRSRTWQPFGRLVHHVNTTQKVVALTFDDGPRPEHIDEILKVLADHQVKASFYVIGEEVESNPQETKALVAAGHELGNHSYSHQRMMFKSWNFIQTEIEKTDDLIKQAGYQDRIDFRPPYSKKLFLLPYYLAKHDRNTIMVDVEPESYPDIANDPQKITQHVLDNVQPGSIILLHPWYTNQASRDAIPDIITQLKQQGYEFKTVSELMTYEGK